MSHRHRSGAGPPDFARSDVASPHKKRHIKIERGIVVSALVTIDQILRLAPNTRSSYREAFQSGQAVLDQSGIADSPLRIAHFLAQVLHESMALTVEFENLNYSPERSPKVWPSRFKPKGHLEPEEFVHNPEALANEVYGKRMGNVDPNDGFTYRGRGLLQLTGRESYLAATTVLRKDFPDVPRLRR